MESINYSVLDKIIKKYKENFDNYRKDEIYKWEAIKHFQENWNWNTKDFSEMLKEALSKSANLLRARNYFPEGMIISMAKRENNIVKKMFEVLFDEKRDIVERCNYFTKKSNELKDKYWKGKNHYQDAHTLSVYLTFMYPEKYYFYKPNVFKRVTKLLEINYNNSDKIQTLKEFFEVSNQVQNYIKDDKELIEISQKSLNSECYRDDKLHILTTDIFYYAANWYVEKRYWMYAPGENAKLWEDNLENGIMALGWDETGDLNQYKDDKEIFNVLKKLYKKDNPMNDKCALDDFKNTIDIGDIIIVKKGATKLLGYGEVMSKYYYDDTRKEYKHVRKVKWIKKGEWNVKDIEGEKQVAQKTLTDITSYGKYPEKLLNFMKDEPVMNNGDRQYFWLNANPRMWSFSELKIGEIIEYTAVNENGNKRQVYANYLAAKKGDLVIAYESTPVKAIVGLCEIDGSLNKKGVLPVRKLENLVNPIQYKEFSNMDELKDMEYLRHPQGSLFKLEEEEYDFLMDMIRENNPIDKNKNVSKYSKNDFNKEVFFDNEKYDEIVDLLMRKKNVILQGAPGVGKTYIAKKLVYSIIGEKNDDRIASVQFHQSYSYEDFIEGYRPTEDGGFELSKGIFYNFCKKAGNDLDNKYFFIIDEINRGNLSKVFGELLVLIENDKRNEKLSLAYSSSEKFHVPENVYIIGLMNTADRSLAIMDYALRRRFAFYDIEPVFDNKRFVEYQKSLNDSFFDKTIENMKKLNKEIESDSSLGKGFEIGHSYFCNLDKKDLDKNIKSILKYEIIPMIEEYWFDNRDKYEEWKKQLLGE